MSEHKLKLVPGFTARYDLTTLVHYECTGDVTSAIAREKQLKGWLREKKIALIESMNPEWRDLSLEWAEPHSQTLRFAQGDKKVKGDLEGFSSGTKGVR